MDLKDIKRRIFKDGNGASNYINVSIEEMDWLVSQAEKVGQLEERVFELSCENSELQSTVRTLRSN